MNDKNDDGKRSKVDKLLDLAVPEKKDVDITPITEDPKSTVTSDYDFARENQRILISQGMDIANRLFEIGDQTGSIDHIDAAIKLTAVLSNSNEKLMNINRKYAQVIQVDPTKHTGDVNQVTNYNITTTSANFLKMLKAMDEEDQIKKKKK